MNSRHTVVRSTLFNGVLAAVIIVAGLICSEQAAQANQAATIGGTAVTGIQAQNTSNQSAREIRLELFPQSGGQPTVLYRAGVSAGSSADFYLPSEAVAGGSYSGVLYSDRSIAHITRMEWTQNGRSGGAIYSGNQSAQSMIIPLVVGPTATSSDGYAGMQITEFTVQNVSPNIGTNAALLLYAQGSSGPLRTVGFSLGPGRSRTFRMGQGDLNNLPDNMNGVGGFLGYVRIDSGSVQAPLAVQAFSDISTSSRAVSAYNGVPLSSGGYTLYMPLLRRDFYGTTGISLVNPNSSQANFTITYYDDPSSPSKMGQPRSESFIIAGNGMLIVSNGNRGGNPLPDPDASTNYTNNNGWFGSARISSNIPLMGIVNDNVITPQYQPQSFGTYNILTRDDQQYTVFAPLIRRRHDVAALTTGIQVQNTGGSNTTISVTYKDRNGNTLGTESRSNVAPGASVNFYQDAASSVVPVGAYGSAVITSNQPIVVLVNESSINNTMDAANYTGVK
jgi:hypothetical protein